MIMCDPGRWCAAPALYKWGGGGVEWVQSQILNNKYIKILFLKQEACRPDSPAIYN